MNKHFCIIIFSFIFLLGCSGTMPKLGIINGQLTPCSKSPNCVNSQATDKEHFIEPIHFIGTMKEAQDQILLVLSTWKRTNTKEVTEHYIRVEFTSKIFRFIDDVEFYFPPTETDKIMINIRSASRIGKSDLGANRKRIELFRNKFEAI